MVINLINVYWFSSLFIYHNTYILSFCIFCQLNVQWKRGLFFFYFTIMIFFTVTKGLVFLTSVYIFHNLNIDATRLIWSRLASLFQKWWNLFRSLEIRNDARRKTIQMMTLYFREIGTSLIFKLCFMWRIQLKH